MTPFSKMTYQNVWWYPNYINYHNEVNCTPKRWSKPDEQHQPSFHDRRYFSPPEDHFEERLYYTLLRLGWPQSRSLFEKPHTVPKHPPDPCVKLKPAGFHGNVYHEDLPPAYKYHGPKKDELYWFERNPYMPVTEDRRLASTKQMYESYRNVKMKPKQLELFTDGPDTTICGCANGLPAIVPVNEHDRRFVRLTREDTIKRKTADGVGYM